MESANFLLPAVAILAVIALLSPKPSLSALLLLLESILINIIVVMNHKDNLNVAGPSILLSFFTMVMVGANYYLEMHDQNKKIKPSKLGMVVGLFSLIFFWQNTNNFFFPLTPERASEASVFKPDTVELLIAGFILFSIMVSAITILDLKNPKGGSL